MAIKPARRISRRKIIPDKVAERLRDMNKAVARRRYAKFVEPILPVLQRMAKSYTKRNKALQDELVNEAVLRIMAAAGKKHVGKPQNLALRIARNAMFEILRQEKIEMRGVQTRPFDEFLLMVDPRARVELPVPDAFELVGRLLAKAKINQQAKDTFAYHYFIREGGPLEYGEFRTVKQTAEHFGIPIRTAKNRLRIVKMKLRLLVGVKK